MKINLQLFSEKKSNEEIAKEVIQGKWGNGTERKNNLAAKGYNYSEIQPLVNSMLGGSSTAPKTNTTVAATTPTTPTPPAAATANTGFKYETYTKPQEVIDMWNKVNSMEKPVEKESGWMSYLNDTINKLMNGEKFSYDLNGDPLYQQYKDQYTTQGKLASMDVMGQAAAMNGGYGSSYGDTVGHQAYQGYLQQLNDRVPELYQLALNQYNQEKQDLKDQAAMYFDLVKRDHDLYREDVSDYYNELEYLTGRADKLSDDSYTKWSDKVGMDYNLYSDEQERIAADKADANELVLSMLSMGLTPGAELLEKAGISSADAQAIVNKVKENEAAALAAASASGSGNGDDDDDIALWNPTGTTDGKGNPIYRNTDGKTQAFGKGINPYKGWMHDDVKNDKGEYDPSKAFKNTPYQPNNIGGKPLEPQPEFEAEVNGRKQKVWSYDNGETLWVWDGSENEYIDVTSKRDELLKK